HTRLRMGQRAAESARRHLARPIPVAGVQRARRPAEVRAVPAPRLETDPERAGRHRTLPAAPRAPAGLREAADTLQEHLITHVQTTGSTRSTRYSEMAVRQAEPTSLACPVFSDERAGAAGNPCGSTAIPYPQVSSAPAGLADF